MRTRAEYGDRLALYSFTGAILPERVADGASGRRCRPRPSRACARPSTAGEALPIRRRMRLREKLARARALVRGLAAAACMLAMPALAVESPSESAAPETSRPAESAPEIRVAIGTARVPESLAAIRPALAAHLRLLLRESGASVQEKTRVLDAAESCAQVAALVANGASHAVLVDLRENGAGLDVVLRAYTGRGCRLVGG